MAVSKVDPSMDNFSVVKDMFVCFIGVLLPPGMNKDVTVKKQWLF